MKPTGCSDRSFPSPRTTTTPSVFDKGEAPLVPHPLVDRNLWRLTRELSAERLPFRLLAGGRVLALRGGVLAPRIDFAHSRSPSCSRSAVEVTRTTTAEWPYALARSSRTSPSLCSNSATTSIPRTASNPIAPRACCARVGRGWAKANQRPLGAVLSVPEPHEGVEQGRVAEQPVQGGQPALPSRRPLKRSSRALGNVVGPT
jgi:hypothetical protein